MSDWFKFYKGEPRFDLLRLLTYVTAICVMFLTVAAVYDMGVRQGQISALKTAYEVCKKVAPWNGEEGCR